METLPSPSPAPDVPSDPRSGTYFVTEPDVRVATVLGFAVIGLALLITSGLPASANVLLLIACSLLGYSGLFAVGFYPFFRGEVLDRRGRGRMRGRVSAYSLLSMLLFTGFLYLNPVTLALVALIHCLGVRVKLFNPACFLIPLNST